MDTKPSTGPSGAGILSLSIAGLVGMVNVTYLVLTTTRALGYAMERVFQLILLVGASGAVVGAILGLRGATQANRHTNVSILGLLLNCSIVIGFVVVHVLKLTGFH